MNKLTFKGNSLTLVKVEGTINSIHFDFKEMSNREIPFEGIAILDENSFVKAVYSHRGFFNHKFILNEKLPIGGLHEVKN